MAVLDFICRDCYWCVDNQTRTKCKREVKVVRSYSVKNCMKTVSARSSGALSKDGMKCDYYSKRKTDS